MAEIKEKSKKARETKGNSEDSLLAIYIFRILKKYSSPDNPLSTQDVMDYLEKDYSIGNADKSDAQKKKIRRHLDTLHECYGGGCVEKIEGKTRKGHDWYYDASRDKFAGEDGKIGQPPGCLFFVHDGYANTAYTASRPRAPDPESVFHRKRPGSKASGRGICS